MALTDSLLAHYLLDNDATDSYGSNDGTTYGGVVFQGDSAYFDGVDGYIDCGLFSVSSVSISCWVSFDVLSEYRHIYASSTGASGSDSAFRLYLNNDSFNVQYLPTDYTSWQTIYTDTISNLGFIIGQKYNFVISYDGIDNVNFYIDSILKTSHALAYGLSIIPSNLLIGFMNNTSNYHKGDVSNIRVYSSAKDQAFIDDLYLEGYSPEPPPLFESFLDISEDVNIKKESFIDVSEDDILESTIFQDVSEDAIIGHEIFSDVAIDSQGYMEIFTDVSIDEKVFKLNRFLDISEDIATNIPSIRIERIN